MVNDLAAPSRSTLDELPTKVLQFLRAAGTSPTIRALLASRGYTKDEHQIGWTLLHTVTGYAPDKPDIGLDADPEVAKAITTLDAWDEENFAGIRAALQRGGFVDTLAFLFNNLEPSTGAGAVASVATLLGRLDALEAGTGRPKASHKDDLAALKLLDQRGYTTKERARLAALVQTAQRGLDDVAPAAPADPTPSKAQTAHDEAEVKLYYWYRDWAAQSKIVIKRKDQKIRLGVASRKARQKSQATPPAPAAK